MSCGQAHSSAREFVAQGKEAKLVAETIDYRLPTLYRMGGRLCQHLYKPGEGMPSVSPFPHTGQGSRKKSADRMLSAPRTTKHLSRNLGPTLVQMLTN